MDGRRGRASAPGERTGRMASWLRFGSDGRNKYLGDPDRMQIPVDELLSEAHATELAHRIRAGAVEGSKPAFGGGPHTANILAVDRERNVVSLFATMGFLFGSGVVIEEFGL